MYCTENLTKIVNGLLCTCKVTLQIKGLEFLEDYMN